VLVVVAASPVQRGRCQRARHKTHRPPPPRSPQQVQQGAVEVQRPLLRGRQPRAQPARQRQGVAAGAVEEGVELLDAAAVEALLGGVWARGGFGFGGAGDGRGGVGCQGGEQGVVRRPSRSHPPDHDSPAAYPSTTKLLAATAAVAGSDSSPPTRGSRRSTASVWGGGRSNNVM